MIDLSSIKDSFAGKPLAVLGLGKSGMSVFAAGRAADIPMVLWDDDVDRRAAVQAEDGVIEDLAQADITRFAALIPAPGIYAHAALDHARAAKIPVFGDIELFHRAKGNVRTIGITGTNGKSTTTALTGHILQAANIASAVGGNIGSAVLTLPDVPTYVIEMSSYQIDQCPTFTPSIAAHLNFSPDHLDRHGGMDGYIAAKERMFSGNGLAVIGIDDEFSKAMFDRISKAGTRKMIAVSCGAEIAGGITVNASGILFDDKTQIIDLNTCPNLKGIHNWQNAAVAYACATAAGATQAQVIAGMQSFPGLAHRQNIVANINGVLYVNDSKATNDQAAAMALRTFDPVYWIAGGRAKEGGYKDCEKYLKRIRHAFLIGEAKSDMAAWLVKQGVQYTISTTLEQAVPAAHALAQREKIAGAAVLLAPACASWDQFRSFEHRGDVFAALVKGLGA